MKTTQQNKIYNRAVERVSNDTVLRAWLPIAFVASVLCLLVYIGLQQYMRAEANYPQTQLAQDIATTLYNNQTPTAVLSSFDVNMTSSLAPFVVVYNGDGVAVDGNGKLNGSLPDIPKGVFAYTQKHLEDHITWQPQANTRIAVVIRYYRNDKQAGFVLAGRNLKEVEHEENTLLFFTSAAWATALCGSLVIITALNRSIGTRK